jgi:hypothetical protein
MKLRNTEALTSPARRTFGRYVSEKEGNILIKTMWAAADVMLGRF